MHPVIARFLDLPQAVLALSKKDTDATLDSEESALIEAGDAWPKARSAVLKAGKHPSPEAQQQLIVLATRAASARVAVDPKLGPRVTSARAALVGQGASGQEADDLIAQAVLEEAFGYAEDPDRFDADFLAETLESLVHLAAVTEDQVDEWIEAFAKTGPADARALRLTVAEALLTSAWSEGPQPITPEHADEALEVLADAVAASEFPAAAQVLCAFLAVLATRLVIGPLRTERLTRIITSAASGGPDPTEEDEDGDDEA